MQFDITYNSKQYIYIYVYMKKAETIQTNT